MNQKLQNDINASIANLNSNISQYYNGNLHAYRVVANELRKLLCDTHRQKDISLVKRFFPDFRLHPLYGDQSKIDKNTSLYIPGRIYSNGKGGSHFEILFNESSPSLPLDDWLVQRLFDERITIKELIRSVADKESAHADEQYNSTLLKTKSVILPGDSLCAKTIIKIGSYVMRKIIKEFSEISKL